MDAITAGLAGIDIDAMAVALGPDGYTATDVETHALSDEQGLYEVAYGTGQALAAGEATGVHLATEIYGDGAVVVGTRFGYEYDLPGYSEGRTGGFVVSVDAAHPRLRAVVHQARALAAGLQHAYQIAVSRAERGNWLLQRNAEYGGPYLETHLQRDRDRLVRRFQFGMYRLLQTLETDQRR